MSRNDPGPGLGDRAGVASVPNTPHAGRYFVTDAILLAGERELTSPIRSLEELLVASANQLLALKCLVRSGAKGERVREQMLMTAATYLQAAKQLGLDSRQDAIAKEIPF
jgi:hypothetical protein